VFLCVRFFLFAGHAPSLSLASTREQTYCLNSTRARRSLTSRSTWSVLRKVWGRVRESARGLEAKLLEEGGRLARLFPDRPLLHGCAARAHARPPRITHIQHGSEIITDTPNVAAPRDRGDVLDGQNVRAFRHFGENGWSEKWFSPPPALNPHTTAFTQDTSSSYTRPPSSHTLPAAPSNGVHPTSSTRPCPSSSASPSPSSSATRNASSAAASAAAAAEAAPPPG